MRAILRPLFAQVPRAYGRQSRSFFSSSILNTHAESIGIGGFIARAVAAAVGYGFFGPRFFGDTDLEFAEERKKDLELLEETEAKVNAYEERFFRNSKA